MNKVEVLGSVQSNAEYDIEYVTEVDADNSAVAVAGGGGGISGGDGVRSGGRKGDNGVCSDGSALQNVNNRTFSRNLQSDTTLT